MASHSFILRGSKKVRTIYVRFRHGELIDTLISTKLKVEEKNWSKTTQNIKRDSNDSSLWSLRSRLTDIHSNLIKLEEHLHQNELIYNKELILKAINGEPLFSERTKMSLIEALEGYKNHLIHENQTGARIVSSGTIKNYNTTKSRIEKFELHNKRNYTLCQLDFDFLKAYSTYARNIIKLSANSVAKDIKQIKTVSFNYRDEGIKIHDNLMSRKFRFETEKTSFVTLTENELRKLVEFKGAKSLENARDWLIIGCWTGCRVGDLMKLTPNNITSHHVHGKEMITYTQSKTGKTIALPVHPQIIEVISDDKSKFPHSISLAKFNEYIKLLCKQAGLNSIEEGSRRNEETGVWEKGKYEKWMLVKSHICRRTFATINYDKLSNKAIMAVTGHSTERMLMNYVGATETDHFDVVYNAWNQHKTNK